MQEESSFCRSWISPTQTLIRHGDAGLKIGASGLHLSSGAEEQKLPSKCHRKKWANTGFNETKVKNRHKEAGVS